jgi:beta-ribofuranosylaminobenzene 5'-phosphate synthase
MSRSVHVRAPSRLHFGMFSFGREDQPQFGGIGVMVDRPAVEITITPASEFIAHGSHSHRVERFVAAITTNWQLAAPPACEIRVSAPPDHVGLGVGTQLGLAVAAGLRRYLEQPDLHIEELAQSVGRGARSAVGTHGFQSGGLIVDGGKAPGTRLGTLVRRFDVPENWRFVLVRRDAEARGFAGDRETDAFARLPGVSDEVTELLWRIANEEMLPAIERSDCDAFGEAVHSFGSLAGECFAPVQGGAFATPATADLVAAIRDHGVRGVGQSSWGPTVFALTADETQAQALVDWLRERFEISPGDITVARPNNSGAQVNVRS